MTEPVTVNCTGSCTVTHVVTVDVPPFNLDAAAAGEIASAVLAVWALGWAFRTFIRTLNIDGDSSTSEKETS